MIRALLIGPPEKDLIAKLMRQAEGSPVGVAQMKRLAPKGTAASLELRDFNTASTIEIPNGFRVTYTHEEHLPGVMLRHLSVSLPDGPAKSAPNPAAIGMIMAAFGFLRGLEDCRFWLEPIEDGKSAINVVEPLDGNWEPLKVKS